MKYFRVGEFAGKAGVSIRTVQYYDRTGLLTPSAYSEAGQRLYTDLDYAKLQQILTLKFIGLSLNEIKQVLTTDHTRITDLLERQKQVLVEKARHLSTVIQTIEIGQQTLRYSPTLDLDVFISIIQAVTMNSQTNWLDQFYTDEQKQKLAAVGATLSLSEQKRIAIAWKVLFTDVFDHMDDELTDPTVQCLVDRWDTLMQESAQNDPELAKGSTNAYLHIGAVAFEGIDNWGGQLQSAAEFIQQAREARDQGK